MIVPHQPPAIHATVVRGDSGSIAVWNQGDSTMVYVVGPHGNAAMPRLTDSVLTAVGISPDSAKMLRDPPVLGADLPDAYPSNRVEYQADDIPKTPEPQYPDQLRADRVEGKVIVQFVIDSTGRAVVRSFMPLTKSNPLFALAVFAALPDLRFKPAQIQGHPVAELVQIPFRFGLQGAHDSVGGPNARATVSFKHDTGSIELRTPTGTFTVHTDSFTMAAWADSAAHARAPTPRGAKTSDYAAIRLAYFEPSLMTTVAMAFVRLTGDSASPYQVTASNGAWDGSLLLPFDSAQRVFALMRGLPSTLSVWREGWPMFDHSKRYASARFERQARPKWGGTPRYPESLREANVEGSTVFRFAVDTSGTVELPSVQVLKSSHPLFALAVYRRMTEMRFEPARVDGHPARELVQEPFAFSLNR